MSLAHLASPPRARPLRLWPRRVVGRLSSPVAALTITTALSALLGLCAAQGAALLLLPKEPSLTPGHGDGLALLSEDELGAERGGEGDEVVHRNVFCHHCERTAAGGAAGGVPAAPAAEPAPRASLVATVRTSPGGYTGAVTCPQSPRATPRPSVGGAVLRPVGSASTRWLQPGSRVGGAQVTAILADRVCYRVGDVLGEWRWDERERPRAAAPALTLRPPAALR